MGCVIAVAAPPGGGKTTLTCALARAAGNAAVIHYDHYEQVTRRPVRDIMKWMKDGSDFDQLLIPQLQRDLAALKRGETVIVPGTAHRIEPAPYIFFDTLLGRHHRPSGEHIDLLIWIDIPPDLALARNLKAITSHFLSGHVPGRDAEKLAWIDSYLASYIGGIREALAIQRQRIRPDADIVVDGNQPVASMVELSLAGIRRRIS